MDAHEPRGHTHNADEFRRVRVPHSVLLNSRGGRALNVAVSSVLMIATAMAACLVPALRAWRFDPVEQLRHD